MNNYNNTYVLDDVLQEYKDILSSDNRYLKDIEGYLFMIDNYNDNIIVKKEDFRDYIISDYGENYIILLKHGKYINVLSETIDTYITELRTFSKIDINNILVRKMIYKGDEPNPFIPSTSFNDSRNSQYIPLI